MSPQNRDGNTRRSRQVDTRPPQTEYYLVVTDTAQTEKNYLEGLKKSLPTDARNKIQIKFRNAETPDLVETCLREAQRDPQYRNSWIVFDRDEVAEFDALILHARQQNIEVAWSNPCLEIWFHAYFGEMPYSATSQDCIHTFSATFRNETGQKYQKNDGNIYRKLAEKGDEDQAIHLAETKYRSFRYNNIESPSLMSPGTTIHLLVQKLKISAGMVQDS